MGFSPRLTAPHSSGSKGGHGVRRLGLMNDSLRRHGNVTEGQDSYDFKGHSATFALCARLTERGGSQSGLRTNQVLRTLWATSRHCLESDNIEMARAVIHRLKPASTWATMRHRRPRSWRYS